MVAAVFKTSQSLAGKGSRGVDAFQLPQWYLCTSGATNPGLRGVRMNYRSLMKDVVYTAMPARNQRCSPGGE